ncbi:Cathepsin B-like protease 2 [Dissostichus eleginoides]|uniref:Cathepsin B-like protease 2 n=1 Tax=Dissostichus eleginoides TaxID=100907 RepID=A0AAD9B205_DISEL|nr:Cathepsin B-like protease 2 [Dissostichus eleginoides]
MPRCTPSRSSTGVADWPWWPSPNCCRNWENNTQTWSSGSYSGMSLPTWPHSMVTDLGVFLNMTDVQVSQAVYCPEKNDYLNKVAEHNTNETFGMAKILLKDQEFGWLLAIISMKTKLAKGKQMSQYVFF